MLHCLFSFYDKNKLNIKMAQRMQDASGGEFSFKSRGKTEVSHLFFLPVHITPFHKAGDEQILKLELKSVGSSCLWGQCSLTGLT